MNTLKKAIDITSPRFQQVLKVTRERQIGFAEYGASTGRPVFYLHGTPSSRLEVGMWDNLCNRLNIRLVVPDRPGIGLSTFVPKRTVADYPQDIAALANHLGWAKFSVVGGSGGAPYVCSCARFLQPQSLDRIGIVAGSGPPEAPSQGLGLMGRGVAYLFSQFPSLVTWALNISLVKAAKDPEASVFEKEVLRARTYLNDTDKAAFDQDAHWIVAATREVYRNDAQGAALDLNLMTKPWGFKLEDIGPPIDLWCGTDDKNTPMAMSRYMAAMIPNAILTEMPGLSHYTIFSEQHMDRIFTDLLHELK